MKHAVLKGLLFFLPFTLLCALEEEPDDQLEVILGTSVYVVYKVLDFANDHGFRYLKILSYEFNGFDHTVSATSNTETNQGRYFELKDDLGSISFLCFTQKPNDPFIIDFERYREFFNEMQEEIEEEPEIYNVRMAKGRMANYLRPR